MRPAIAWFIADAARDRLAFYNECTLQLELALYLRQKFPELTIQLERPVTDFGRRTAGAKKEIDICVLSADGAPLCAIEIKMPLNGRVPECMFDYCRDVHFCETLVDVGFKSACAFLLTPDEAFRRGHRTDGIYSFFRSAQPLCGRIRKPTGKRDSEVQLQGSYALSWNTALPGYEFLITEIGAPKFPRTS